MAGSINSQPIRLYGCCEIISAAKMEKTTGRANPQKIVSLISTREGGSLYADTAIIVWMTEARTIAIHNVQAALLLCFFNLFNV